MHAPLTLIVHCHLWVSSSASTCGQLLPVAEAMEYVWRGMQALSAVGFEPTRSYLQWILSPPLDRSGKLTSDKAAATIASGVHALCTDGSGTRSVPRRGWEPCSSCVQQAGGYTNMA